jgi:hypothetical protein
MADQASLAFFLSTKHRRSHESCGATGRWESLMVVIGKQVLSGLLGLIPDAIIAWIAAEYTDSGIFGFILTLIGLWCVYLLIWAKNSLWMWLMYWVSVRRQMTDLLEDHLIKDRFPPPPEYVSDIDEYLTQVANSDKYDCQTRVKAAIDLGTFNGLSVAMRGQLGFQLQWAFQAALQRYARRFPPPPPQDDE